MKKILLLFSFILIFCGCSDYKELNNIAIVSGIAIDKKEKKYEVSVLVANSKTTNENNTEATAGNAVYSVENTSISTAMQRLDSILPKQVYLGHLGVVVISEQVARDGVEEITDYFFRNPETTKRFYLIMTEHNEKAENVLKILSPLESFPFQNIRLNIENASTSGALSHNITYSKFLERYLKKGSDPFLPTIIIKGSVDEGSSTKSLESSNISSFVEVKGIALFKDDKFVDYADTDESRGINLAMGNVEDAIIETKCNQSKIITKMSNIQAKKQIVISNNKPILDIKIKGIGDIEEVNCDINLYENKNLIKIKKNTEKEIKRIIEKGINKSKEIECDILEIGNMVYKKNPKYFYSIKDWNKELKNVDVNINVYLDIQNKGSIKQSVKVGKK